MGYIQAAPQMVYAAAPQYVDAAPQVTYVTAAPVVDAGAVVDTVAAPQVVETLAAPAVVEGAPLMAGQSMIAAQPAFNFAPTTASYVTAPTAPAMGSYYMPTTNLQQTSSMVAYPGYTVAPVAAAAAVEEAKKGEDKTEGAAAKKVKKKVATKKVKKGCC